MDTTIMNQKAYTRKLAVKVAEYASSKENYLTINRWNDVNDLKKPDRAPVWCKPVGAWHEIIPKNSLYCSDPFMRSIELELKKILYKIDIGDDTPVYNYYPVNTVWEFSPSDGYGIKTERNSSNKEGGAWGYVPSVKGYEDIKKLVIPDLFINEVKTRETLEKSFDILGDILPVKLVHELPANAIVGHDAAGMRGLEGLMMDTVLEPELLHALISYIRDRVLYLFKKAESMGKITPNNMGSMYQCNSFGPEPKDGKFSLKNCWCAANSQEFDQVSPESWEEFCLNYQKPIFDLFGYVAYGCCENLTKKVDSVLTIPNLRILVCSAWTNLDVIIEKSKKDYVIMWRQKASDVLYTDDINKIRQDLIEGCKKLKYSYYQIVLREIETLFGHTKRLHEWTKFAKEAAWQYS